MNTEKLQIEFTDRYGGNPPSWLRSCLGYGCQATGYIPVKQDDKRYAKEWTEAEKENPTNDKWHFITCPGCKGTAKVSWFKTFIRLPRWFVNGIKFIFTAPNMSGKLTWTDIVLKFKCAFLVDLGLWRP